MDTALLVVGIMSMVLAIAVAGISAFQKDKNLASLLIVAIFSLKLAICLLLIGEIMPGLAMLTTSVASSAGLVFTALLPRVQR